MKNGKITCKTGLKKDIVSREVFLRETHLCHKLFNKNKGECGWGVCKACGVIPLLYKLHKGKLLEDPVEIKKEKDKIFINNKI